MVQLRITLTVLVLIAAVFFHSIGFAYNKQHYIKLIETKVCRNCDLTCAPLSKIDLTGADLRGSWLTYATFRKSTLYKAKLPDSRNYRGADFTNAMWTDGGICQRGSIGKCTCYVDEAGDSKCK